MYADDSSVKPMRIDGYPPGTLVTFSIGADGVITGVYDNGRQQPLGLLALATFENPAGLQKVGSNEFIQTTNSGEFKLPHKPGSDGAGTLLPGTLEMSNVDLAKQFTEMIITQRGFQANSRVMTTSDEFSRSSPIEALIGIQGQASSCPF
jgi:flagellar hook protein FlgE